MVLIVAVTAVVVLTSRGDDRAQPAPAPTRSSEVPTARSSTVPTSVRTAPPTAQREPLVPGWQVAEVPKRSAVYDVPADWEIDPDPEAVYGYGEPQDAVTVTGVATYRRGFCTGEPNSYRATAGATARRGPDDTTVATETSQKFIAEAYGRDGLAPIAEPAPPEHIRLPGGMSAVRIDTEVTLPNPQRCDAPVVEVSVVATNNDGDGSVVFIAAADQGIPDAVSPEVLHRISASLRAG
ncbi:hypothetical protein [Saccharopolyspora halophila]|uniref:hypothetical protein n=1 Tax=Saccharopolyspora halophila TaxID=405551 RepID=UPI0031D151C7